MSDPTNAELLARAGERDEKAWELIVDRFAGLVWSIVRGYRLGPAAEADVFQTVWLRLAENIERIREPDRLAGWLARTAKNEAVAIVRQRQRTTPSDDVGETLAVDADHDGDLLRTESDQAVAAGLSRLSPQCQQLLRLLVADPSVSYAEISDVVGVPIGSIGPTRARCLERLRNTPEVSRITHAG